MSRRRATAAALPLAAAILFLLLTSRESVPGAAAAVATRIGLWTGVLLSCATLAGGLSGSRLRGWRHVIWDGSAGLAVLMSTLLALGLLPGGFRGTTLMVLTGMLVAAAAGFRIWRYVGSGPAPPPAPLDGAPGSATALILGLVAGLGLIWNRVPPVFFDTLVYHYAQPGLWLLEGRYTPATWSLYSWFPPGMSALYGLGMAWGGEAAAGDANLLFSLLLLALVGDLAGQLWGRTAAWVAPLLLATLPITVHALGIPGADLAHGTFVFATLAAWLLWRRDGDGTWLVRAGLLAGGSILTKALGLLVPAAFGLALFGVFDGEPLRNAPATRLRRAVAFGLLAGVLALPWLGANLAVLGNPVAPVLAPVLPVDGLAEGGHAAFYDDAMGGLPSWPDLQWLVPRLFTGDPTSEGIYPTPAWGWAPPVLLCILLLWGRSMHDVEAPAALLVAATAAWLLTFRWERFLVGITALLATLLAGAIVHGWRRGPLPRVVTLVAIPLAILGTVRAVQSVLSFTGGLPVALGKEGPEQLTERSLPLARMFRMMEDNLDADRHRVLFLGETRHHGLGIPREAPAVFNTHRLMAQLADDPDPATASAVLCRDGFTHLLVDPGWMARSAARYPSLALVRTHPATVKRYLASLGAPAGTASGLDLFALPNCPAAPGPREP